MTDTTNDNNDIKKENNKITSLQLVGIPPIDRDLYDKLSKHEQVFYHTIPTAQQKTCFVHMGIEDRAALMDENTLAEEKAERWATASTRALKVINGGLVRNERSKFLNKAGKWVFGAGFVSMVGDAVVDTVLKNEQLAKLTHATSPDSPLSQLWYVAHGLVAPNAVVALSLLLSGAYFGGMYVENKRKQDEQAKVFNNKGKSNFFAWYFDTVNKGLDWASYLVLKAQHPIQKVFTDIVPDKALRKLDNKIFRRMKGLISGNYSERVEMAKKHFSNNDDGFMWQKVRAKDFRTQSTVIAGRMFNGKPLEQYLPMFMSEKTYLGSVRAGLLIALISFALTSALYRPQAPQWLSYGYTADRVYQDQVEATAQALKADNPKLTNADSQAQALVDDASTSIFGSGLLTSFLMSLGIGLMFSRRAFVKAYKSLEIPYVKNMIDEYNRDETRIQSYKEAVKGSNLRATTYDADRPLIGVGVSVGSTELKGVYGAPRKGQILVYSLGDQCQNTFISGGTGGGKTETIIKTLIRQELNIYRANLNDLLEYEKHYDLRNDRVRDHVNLDKYTALPIPKLTLGMSIMDIKAQLWKDIYEDMIKPMKLEHRFLIIGADQKHEFSIDLLYLLEPVKVVSIFKSLAAQMGISPDELQDFWNGSGFGYIQHFTDVAYLFSRTPEGEAYMEAFEIKPMSLFFIFSLAVRDANRGNQLLAHCITAIHKCVKNSPDRLVDILNEERLNSLNILVTKWQQLPVDMRGSFDQVIKRLLAGMDSESLRPFLTGIGENAIDIKNLRQYIVAFNLDMDKYDQGGKFVLLFAKTLLNEEAIKRQQRYSRRVIEISNHFFAKYGDRAELKSKPVSIEMLPMDAIHPSNIPLLDQYLVLCEHLQQVQNEVWEGGDYYKKIVALAAAQPREPFQEGKPYSQQAIALAVEALAIDSKFRQAESRLTSEITSMDGLDPHWFEVQEGDSEETRQEKNRDMALYHEYRDAKTRVRREAFIRVGDEYQELITADKSGGAYTDMNFLNVSRSANEPHILATQTLKALIQKVGKEITDNFINQFRNFFMLTSEDPDTYDFVEKLSGKADTVRISESKSTVYQAGVPTSYVKYDNFNGYISELVSRNRDLEAKGLKPESGYRFTYDIFAEPDVVDVDFSEVKLSNPFSSTLSGDDTDEIAVPDFKQHFLDYKAVEQYTAQGSSSQGINDNQNQIQAQWAQAQDKMVENYNKFATDNIRKGEPIFTSQDFRDLGPTQAFVYMTRAGRSFVDVVQTLDWRKL
ncbi:hypothetical protein [Paraburkholderia aromaticivorans]|uniref:hypothetical protein n=1 Tax=Paraburkholderia aromaticivorans TaxID=2026199 RepID=UPI0038BA4FF6